MQFLGFVLVDWTESPLCSNLLCSPFTLCFFDILAPSTSPSTMPSLISFHSHPIIQSLLLIASSLFFLPLITFLALLAAFISPWLSSTKHVRHTRRWRSLSSSTFRPRTILVTNLRPPEAVALARIFYRAGHRVIGAEYEEYYFPIPAHFSSAIEVFYRLGNGKGERSRERYLRDLLDVVRKERIEMWVNCEDLEVKEVLERKTGCRVLGFDREVMELLGDEARFRKEAKKLALNIAERHLVTSKTEALEIFDPAKPSGKGKQYTIKSTSSDGTASSETALLPLSSSKCIKSYIRTLDPSPSNPLELQEYFPDHQQYTAYALIINSKPAAFVAYPTPSNVLTPLSPSSLISQSLFQYNTRLVSSLPPKFKQAGHLNLTFTLPSESQSNNSESSTASLLPQIHLFSLSPFLNLGTLAFKDVAEDLASAYLSFLPDHEPRGVGNGNFQELMVVPSVEGIGKGYYFLPNEFWRSGVIPFLGVLRWQIGIREFVSRWNMFLGLVIWSREVWWEIWDPWAWWWRYGGYLVGMGLIRLWKKEALNA